MKSRPPLLCSTVVPDSNIIRKSKRNDSFGARWLEPIFSFKLNSKISIEGGFIKMLYLDYIID